MQEIEVEDRISLHASIIISMKFVVLKGHAKRGNDAGVLKGGGYKINRKKEMKLAEEVEAPVFRLLT